MLRPSRSVALVVLTTSFDARIKDNGIDGSFVSAGVKFERLLERRDECVVVDPRLFGDVYRPVVKVFPTARTHLEQIVCRDEIFRRSPGES
jgi:hypothetical protein